MNRSQNKGCKRAPSGALAVTIKAGERIGMYKAVTEILGKPSNINFWWGKGQRILAIAAASTPTDMSIPVPEYFYNTRNGSRLRNMGLLRALQNLTGWADGSVHLLVGEFIPELDIIVFKIDDEKSRWNYE